MTKLFTLGLGLVLAAGIGARSAYATGAGDDHTVLILGPTVSGGASSVEAQKAEAIGMTVEVVDAAGWMAKSAADFATYRALILGDPTCSGLGPQQAAEDTVATWGPVVDGNVILIGTDERFHDSQGGNKLSEKAVDFAAAEAGKTGAMVSLSCYYHGTVAMTPVPVLDAFAPGGFTVTGVGCYNDAHIVADHPAITCPPGSPPTCDPLTDADLSGWSCSVHEAFDTWPADFLVLAMARGIGDVFTATDGSVGTPYILARGESLRARGLSLSPVSDTNPTATDHTVTAELRDPDDNPVAGSLIGFHVIAGPNMGATGTCNPADCLTDAIGHVAFTYTSGGGVGEDTIEAFVDANANGTADIGEARTTAKKTWIIFDPFGGLTKVTRRDLSLKLHRPEGADGVRCVETDMPDAPDFDTIPFTMFPEGTDDIELPIELTAPFGEKTVCCQFSTMDIPVLQPVCDAVTLDTGSCEGKPAGAECSTCPEGSSLSTGTCDASGACNCNPEICGNCLDDDNNGLTDYEDPACCPAASTAAMTVKKGKFGGGSTTNGSVRLKTILAQSGFNVDPRSQDTTVQMRNANGELFCHTITHTHWMKRSKVQSQFWTKDPSVAGGLTDGSIFTKKSGKAKFRTKGRINLSQFNASPLTVTVNVGGVGGKCSSGVVTLKQKGKKLVGP